MKMFYTLLIVALSTLLLMNADFFTSYINIQIHANNFMNGLAKYQFFALSVGLVSALFVLLLFPDSKKILKVGQMNASAEKEVWLGINGMTSWKVNGLQLLLFVSLATGIFMFLAVNYTNSWGNFKWNFIPWVLLFSLTNSLAEELIYRFSIIGALFNRYPKRVILIISAIMFGLPHYLGFPNGVIGVLMSGVLGYILGKATVETKGLSIAWVIHFVQDVIIFSALMMMNVK